MRILESFNYREFKCVGGCCVDTCCSGGWKIGIDKNTYKRYKKINGDIGLLISKNIGRDRVKNTELEYGKIMLDEEGKCSLLSSEGLCTVQLKLGEEYLCNTCKIYPRKIKLYGEFYERNMTISCPVIAESLIKSNVFSFNIKEGHIYQLEREYIMEEKCNRELYDLLFQARLFSIELAQFREIDIWKRLSFIIMFNYKLQDIISKGNYKEGYKIIEDYKIACCDMKVIEKLDSIKSLSDVKLAFIKGVLQNKNSRGITNKTFQGLIEGFNELVKEKEEKEVVELFEKLQLGFEEYFKNNEYILENYIVYNLYDNYMLALKSKDVKKEILRLIISYAIVKLMLMVRYEKNKGVVNDNDIVDVLYSFSRTMEHNEGFMGMLCNSIKEGGYDTIGYLTILSK